MTRDEKIAKIKTLRKDGKSYDEIAKVLKLSPQRVGYYVRTIEGKSTRKRTNGKKTVAKKTTRKAKSNGKKTESKGAKRARQASAAYGKAMGLTKPNGNGSKPRPQPKSVSARKPKPVAEKIAAPKKTDLAAAASAVQG